MTVKTAVLVSGGGTNLQAMLDAKKAGAMAHVDFTLVVASRADAFALERAKKAGIETAVLKKEKTEPAEAYGERLLALLAAHGIELVVLAGFLTILPENVVRAYDHRMINIHPSLIPAFCGEGFYGLRVHEAALARGALGAGKIALVVSNRKAAYALERAKNHDIPSAVLSKYMAPDPDEYDARLEALLASHQIDMIALAGFLGIVGPRVLRRWEGRIVNIHPALIPSFCGMGYYGLKVHEAALERGVKVTGATAHLVSGEVDGGPILLQKAVYVQEGDTPETLQKRVMEQAEWEILPRAVAMICEKIAKERA